MNAAAPLPSWAAPVCINPDALARIQTEFAKGWHEIMVQAHQGGLRPPADRRFQSEAWQANPASLLMAHSYLLSSRALLQMVDAAQLPAEVQNRLRFAVMQWVDAMSPANFLALNPDAQKTLIDTGGESLRQGLLNLLEDMRKGRLSHTDESSFEVGKNLATTPGQVIYENRLFQLIQYQAQTPQVYEKPLLIVPPCINKYYILDLQPQNSFVRYAVEQGFTVFLVSWRNPHPDDKPSIAGCDWDDYLQEGVLAAIDVVQNVSRQEQINALGFCVGGTLLGSAVALARAQGRDPVSSLTLLTAMLDFSDTGVLDVFVDEFHASLREHQFQNGGLMTAAELNTTFSFLRPNELVWNYVVANYLKGQTPPAFDLLYWNADGTNLPGKFFAWYFRNTYLENKLKDPGEIVIQGHPIDFSSLSMPAYIYGSREDHIVPWHTAYVSCNLLSGQKRFVLGASGHIAGVINPPAAQRRSYWTLPEGKASALPVDSTQWLEQAQEHRGSWWPDWAQWLSQHSGQQKNAPRALGNRRHKPIEPAPGRYVKVRAV